MFAKKDDLSSLKIGDFGLSSNMQDSEYNFSGTLAYMAPEQLKKGNCDAKVDIFSAAFVLYLLCSGGAHPVYRQEDNPEKYTEKLLNTTEFNFPLTFPVLARNLFLKAAKFNRNYRYECYYCLNHPFVTRTDTKIPIPIIEEYTKSKILKEFRAVNL